MERYKPYILPVVALLVLILLYVASRSLGDPGAPTDADDKASPKSDAKAGAKTEPAPQ